MADLRYPVLTGTTIKGRHPRLARWLRRVAVRIDDLADRYDDRHVLPFHSLHAERSSEATTITWGSKYADVSEYLPEDDE